MNEIDELIAECLSGEISEENRIKLSLWIEESSENRKYFIEKREVWFSSMSSDELKTFAPGRAFIKFLKEMVFSGRFRNDRPKFVYKIAASSLTLAACVAAAFFLLSKFKTGSSTERVSEILIQAPAGSRSSVTLPDGTSILLNSGSEISYASDFATSNRAVALKGEAYFNVKHSDTSPFVVRSGKMEIVDLGTVFSVCNYEDDTKASVVLVEGKVSCAIEDLIVSEELAPGQIMIYDKDKMEAEVSDVNADEAVSWIRGCYIFEDEPLSEIVKKLERGFAVEIDIENESMASMRFYGSFDDTIRSVDEILETFAATGKMKFSSNGGGRYKIKK